MSDPVFPCIWFDSNAREAADFYCSIFPESEITGDSGIVVTFELKGRKFMALNGGPYFTHSEAVSFVVECEDQYEIDYYWEKLTDGGKESQCGWLKDRFGVSWQIVPRIMGDLMDEPEKAQRVTAAFMKMRKLELNKLIEAANS